MKNIRASQAQVARPPRRVLENRVAVAKAALRGVQGEYLAAEQIASLEGELDQAFFQGHSLFSGHEKARARRAWVGALGVTAC